MTNRRRSGKGRTSSSKKNESPEKHKIVTRRSRRSKKSESPEKPEEVDSEYSGEEQAEDGNPRKFDGDKNEHFKDGGTLDSLRSDDQKLQLKEEESGGSDGSWKVKSENGGGGGIPKLKLCLTRPPDTASPTSLEQHPSPRRRKRSGRGNITPTKEDDHAEINAVEDYPKRITRNQKAKTIAELENVSDDKHEEVPVPATLPTPEPEPSEAQIEPEPEPMEHPIEPESQTNHPETKEIYNSRYNEEDETRMAVESICAVEQIDESETSGPTQKDHLPESEKEKVETRHQHAESDESKRTEKEPHQGIKEEDSVVESRLNLEQNQAEPDANKRCEESKIVPKPEAETISEPIRCSDIDKRRSSSRDSSEERAKEEALRSRNKNRKKEDGFQEKEIRENSRSHILHERSQEEIEKASSLIAHTDKSDTKENAEEPTPHSKSGGARKRRWGSSTNQNSKKQTVSISTDFLKEIIPEAKPLTMSEVQLSPNEEDEEGQLKDSEENLPMIAKKPEREKILQSDESEKDYEEEGGESGTEEIPHPEPVKPPSAPIKEKEVSAAFTRKVSVLSSNERLPKSPSPPRHKPSNIIYIVNLVRPFTIPQLRELLARTGTIVEDGFWIDKIKSRCYVKYETEEEAKTTRHALHGIRWPVSNPKQLIVDFGTESAMKAAVEGNEVVTKRPIPSLFEKQIELKTGDHVRDKGVDKRERNEKEKKERVKVREEEKREEADEDKEKKSRPAVEPLVRDRTVRRVTMPVREWDLGKNEDGFSPPHEGIEFSRHRDDRYERRVEYDRDKRDDYDERRRREKDRNRRSVSGEPPRKSKKKNEDETPAKLLDDLFRKTKATPCIYWLPLTPEQIAVKEEMRRKHMAEHEKKIAELRKMQSKRSSEKRRRRTKSRSRSRSVKK